MNRFKMIFNNSGAALPNLSQFNNLGGDNSLASFDKKRMSSFAPRNISLNAPMIDRVHKAKPGCSACGKKVA
jgi:hypothetical protein